MRLRARKFTEKSEFVTEIVKCVHLNIFISYYWSQERKKRKMMILVMSFANVIMRKRWSLATVKAGSKIANFAGILDLKMTFFNFLFKREKVFEKGLS